MRESLMAYCLRTGKAHLLREWMKSQNEQTPDELGCFQPKKGVVAVRPRTCMGEPYRLPLTAGFRLSLLLQSHAPSRLQRSGLPTTGPCGTVVSAAQRKPDAEAGFTQQPPQGVVAVRAWTCMENGNTGPHGRRPRLPHLRGSR